jgi:hypothetical protein
MSEHPPLFWRELRAHLLAISAGSGLTPQEIGREIGGNDAGHTVRGFVDGLRPDLSEQIIDQLEAAGLLPEEIWFSEDQEIETEIAVQIPGQMNLFKE